MKISIDTSSFSFRFIAVWLAVLAIISFLFFCKTVGLIIFLIAVILYTQKYKYLIPKGSIKVSQKIEKTIKSLGLNFEKTLNGFSTKTTHIGVYDLVLFTVLHFKFDKVYNVQGKYLAEAVVKYQRYP